ncbi:MAG TPA: hypothetical protein VG838_18535 [Opitutaceae bacterium]|nr:hypothetical protein [Opitutaceae bacterium]
MNASVPFYGSFPAPLAPLWHHLAPWPAAPAERSFTCDGDHALEGHLERTCARVLSGVRGLVPAGRFEGLFLGGGYGRGEGGVLRDPGGDRPYNDLEFYVALRGNRHLNELRFRRRLEVLGEILTPLADVELEFKITSLAELAARPVSMFSYDLVAGHRLLWGRPEAHLLAGCEHHRRAENIPLEEATRLLLNRCSGLLFAREQLAREPFTAEAADFVRRNIAKARLACGDALLAAGGLYVWSCRERHRWLQRLARTAPWPWSEDLVRHHAAGVEFKLHPESGGLPREELRASLDEISVLARDCWLWIESRRLGGSFASVRAYAADAADKCPGSPALRNLVLNLRADRGRPRLQPNPLRHPRQRLFRALALLLWEPEALTDLTLRRRLQRDLHTRAATLPGMMPAYRALWERVR